MRFNIRHAARIKKWAKNPPGEKQVKLFFAIVAICLVLFAIERVIGWPDWLTMPNTPSGRVTR